MGTLLPLAACSSLSGGGGNECSQASTQVARLIVGPPQVEVVSGVFQELTPQAFNSCGYEISNVNYLWKSQNPTLASVDSNGLVRGISTGTVTIEATAISVGADAASGGNVTASATVTVTPEPFSGVVDHIEIYPADPVVLIHTQRQMVAVAYDQDGNQITDATFSWRTDHPEIADITNSGLVTANQAGLSLITVQATGSASIAWASTELIVTEVNGGPLPDPTVAITPFGVVMGVGDTREVQARVTAPYTGNAIQVPITWAADPPGYIVIEPLGEFGEIARLTGTAKGDVELTATATTATGPVASPPIQVNVLYRAQGTTGDWLPSTPLPVPLYGHGMGLVGDRLFVTGGVAGVPIWGGPREDVRRGLLDAYSGFVTDRTGEEGWDHSEHVLSPDPIDQVLGECTLDPVCMYIWRDATDTLPGRTVHYQVFRHAQVSTNTHVYVLGGIDAQVDLGVSGEPTDLVGPDQTRFSDRVLIGTIGQDGSLDAWYEGNRLPAVGYYLGGYEDVPGRADLAAAIYDNKWLYAMGGWSWVRKPDFAGNYTYVGRNREEVFRAEILSNGDLGPWILDGRLPDPLNKHAAAVVGDWLYVSGGAYGTGEFAETVSDRVFRAKIDPVTGDVGSFEQVLPNLPRPLQGHSMVAAPGGLRLVVVGGNNLIGASSDAFLTGVNVTTGDIGDWLLLPPYPIVGGITEHASVATLYQTVGGGVLRVLVSGGGTPSAGDISDLIRTGEMYYLDTGP